MNKTHQELACFDQIICNNIDRNKTSNPSKPHSSIEIHTYKYRFINYSHCEEGKKQIQELGMQASPSSVFAYIDSVSAVNILGITHFKIKKNSCSDPVDYPARRTT